VSTARPLRIAFVVPDLRIGGAERHAVEFVSNVDRSRFEPAVLCLGEEGQFFASLPGDVPATVLHRTKREAARTVVELIRWMREFRPDVVVVRGYNAEALGRIAGILTRVPTMIVWVHNSGDATPRGRVRRSLDRLLQRSTTAYFGVARSQLGSMRDDLGLPSDKVRIIHNGVDPAKFRTDRDPAALSGLGIGDGSPVVGIVAALRPEKDHATFLRAARLVADQVPDVRFVIVGDGDGRAELERLAAKLGIGTQVSFAGARHDIPDVLAAIDVFVLSSRTVECFPMALLEAMASGRPAVCTDVGGVQEMIDDDVTGFLVRPGDPAALAERLVLLLTDDERRRAMGAAARKRVETEFTLSRSIDEAARAIEEIRG
jgi:glycosyltransferase involved in cell wall biosynthesis